MTPASDDARAAAESRAPIAIIGVGCRFPGATNPDAFWSLLREGVDGISEVPADRWNAGAFYDADPTAPGKMNSRWGGFLEHVDRFDPQFFGILPREAASIDPQHRMMLEVAWEAFEDAGIVATDLAGSATGVFVGISTNDYGQIEPRDPRAITAYWSTGNALNIAAARIAYCFDLHGPAVAIDTACSASLVAVHYACSSLWSGECTMALAGGVNLILSPTPMINFAKSMALAPDGRCKAFDRRADGIVRGEGAGVVLLRPLADALAHRDPIRAVIRGSAVNQDGRTNGLTAPSRRAQEAVLRAAYRHAGIDPARVDYVEAHGTATFLGDPIELRALGAVVSAGRPADRPCAVGSVKTNIGHLESAAGIASLIKVVLALEHGEIPPSLHFREPNPHIPFDELRLKVQDRLGPWPRDDRPAVAGVSSFGFGGTNGHLVVEQAPPAQPIEAAGDTGAQPAYLLPVSAHSAGALQDLARALMDRVRPADAASAPDDIDLCYTASVRRTHHAQRLSIVYRSRGELIRGFEDYIKGWESPSVHFTHTEGTHRDPRTVFAFSGQGAGWWRANPDFFLGEPVVARAIEECDALLQPLTGWSLREAMTTRDDVPLYEMGFLQPAMFAVQVALARLWISRGIQPSAIVGHSMGEVAAAHVAGVLRLEDAVRVIYGRGALMQYGLQLRSDAPAETMAAVRLSMEDVQRELAEYEGKIGVAAHNSPKHIVLAGNAEALGTLVRKLNARRIPALLMPVSGAGHAAALKRLGAELASRLGEIVTQPATVPIYSTVTGRLATSDEFTIDYWARQMSEPVLFSNAVETLVTKGHDVFLEISRHPLVTGAITECLTHHGRRGTVVASLQRGEDETATLLSALGALYTRGAAVRWQALYPNGRCVPLPMYPWQRRRFWFGDESGPTTAAAVATSASRGVVEAEHPRLGRHIRSAASPDTYFWQITIDDQRFPALAEYRLEGLPLAPPSLIVDLLLEAANTALAHEAAAAPGSTLVLEHVRLLKPLLLSRPKPRQIQLVLTRRGTDAAEASLFDVTEADGGSDVAPTLVAATTMRIAPASEPVSSLTREGLAQIGERCLRHVAGADLYTALAQGGVQVGRAFQSIEELRLGSMEAVGRIRTSAAAPRTGSTVGLEALDGGLHAAANALSLDGTEVYWPTDIARMVCRADAADSKELSIAIACSAPRDDSRVRAGLAFVSDKGAPVLGLEGILAEPLANYLQRSSLLDWFYEVGWKPRDLEAATDSERGRWIVLCDDGGVGVALAARLEADGHEVIRGYRAHDHDTSSPDRVVVNASNGDDYVALCAAGAADLPLRGVVHLWSLDAPEASGSAPLNDVSSVGCSSALLLVQALARRAGNAPTRLWLVTRGAQAVAGDDPPVSIAQAPIWGFGRTVAGEERGLWGGLVDLDPRDSIERHAALLHYEMTRAGAEDQIAFRGATRYVARLVRAEPGRRATRTHTWDPNGAYLVSGGLGELGLIVARWMAEQGARHIVLLGRTPLAPRAAWADLDPASREARQAEAIRAIESTGASVEALAVDVAEESALAAALADVRTRVGPIRGVAHLAGVVHGAPIAEMDVATLTADLRPKLVGGWLLHALLAGDPIDFFVLFSSGSAVLPSPLLAGYAAANAGLDALAHHRHALGLPALSVNWGFWQDAGMAARQLRELGRQMNPRGMLGFTNEQGLDVLTHLLGQSVPQAVVMHYNWKAWGRFHPAAAAAPFLAELFAAPGVDVLKRSPRADSAAIRDALLAAEPDLRRQLLEDYLRTRALTTLGISIDEWDPGQPLTYVGVDSLMALEMKHDIEEELGVVIPVTQLLQAPTLEQIITVLLDQLDQQARRRGGTAVDSESKDVQPAAFADDPAALLQRVDELPIEEVDTLLRSMGVGD